ncbi:MAG: hydroxyacylglutathione hydrolase, partial [Gammaproteobacteria bacterium]|nr:hydroxyacylglutathione hydrolase [Gammaproteobacteria bacterium]
RAASVSLRRLVREVRTLAEEVEFRDGDWREVIAAVRAVAPLLWQRLAGRERERFLRHMRSYWDVHRHRLPPCSWSALNELRRSGRLVIHAGRVLDMEPVGRQVSVTWRARGTTAATTILVDRVVNCTGPQYDLRHTRDRLLRSLTAQGTVVRDAFGVGIMTDEFGAALDASGRIAGNLYYIGPMLRPRYWETTAVPELRVHAERLAYRLSLPAQPASTRHHAAGARWAAGAIA